MDLSKLCSCLNNTAQIDGTINDVEQINSKMTTSGQINSDFNNISRVYVRYKAKNSDNIEVFVDNTTDNITATIKEIQFDSAENFPKIGSDRLIYVDKGKNTPYRWDKETSSYKSLGKDLSAEFEALEKEIEGVEKSSIKDILVNDETSVGEDKKSNINIQLKKDPQNDLIYYLEVNSKKAGEINIPKDQFLKSVTYDPDTHIITFVWVTTTGEQKTTIDISDLIDVYTAGNGLELYNNTFSIKVDPSSSGMLTVSKDGIKLKLEPATEKNFGLVRAWIEDDYLCISTEKYVPFVNVVSGSYLKVAGSFRTIQEGPVLKIL